MQSFLHTVAEQLYQRFSTQMHTVAVVFPNRRQSVFFSNCFQQIAAPPCFMPELLTIEELVATSTTLQVADNLTQGFALYEAFVAVAKNAGDAPNEIPPFDVFFSIGETILKDFREIDSYLVDIDDVCKVLYDIEAIDKAFDQLTAEQREFLHSFWKGTTDKGRIQEKFLKLWLRLPAIYKRYQQLLQNQQQTTMGITYRQLASGEMLNPDFLQQWSHIAFVGFNAFNKAEETTIKKWNDEGFASLWFDADAWYINNPQQEAGFFLRRNFHIVALKNELPLVHEIENRIAPIQITGTDGQHAQAKLVAPWWNLHRQASSQEQMGILLADETLLLPVLQSLPESMEHINITMGYPLQQSQVFSLLQLFFEIQNDLLKHRFQTVHHTIVGKWLQHAFCNWPPEAIEKLQLKMLKENLVRVPVSLLSQHSESAALLFTRMMADMEVFQRLRQLLETALHLPVVKTDSIAQGLCVAAWKTLHQLEPLFAKLPSMPDVSFIGSLLMKQLGSISVPFEGEPLQGVQVMGLLESRGLDFDHIILVGASEGSLPRIKPPDSFLPDNVRRAFGLPVPEHQDAIFSYVFYRLLHRAKTVQLVYNALVTENSTGEVSRFIKQIAFETKIPIQTTSVSNTVFPDAWPTISITKNKEVMNRLFHYFKQEKQQPISPSAINTYLNCQLSFFFRYLARLEEPEQLEEGVEASSVGSVVHKLLELLYEANIATNGHTITETSVAWMKEQAENFIETAFRQKWRKTVITGPFQFSGELHVVRAIVLQYTHFFLDLDAAYAPFMLHEMEVKFQQPFGIAIEGRPQQITLSGYIDRVDEKGGVFRMVDYKTGGDDPNFKSIDALFERDGKKQNKGALQTLIYSWMFHKAYPQHERFQPALLAARHLQNNAGKIQLFNLETKQPVDHFSMQATLQQVEVNLRKLLEELFDASVPFAQTTIPDNCKYCDFKSICGR